MKRSSVLVRCWRIVFALTLIMNSLSQQHREPIQTRCWRPITVCVSVVCSCFLCLCESRTITANLPTESWPWRQHATVRSDAYHTRTNSVITNEELRNRIKKTTTTLFDDLLTRVENWKSCYESNRPFKTHPASYRSRKKKERQTVEGGWTRLTRMWQKSEGMAWFVRKSSVVPKRQDSGNEWKGESLSEWMSEWANKWLTDWLTDWLN